MSDETIFQLLKRQADTSPERIAIQALGKEPLPFGELMDHVESVVATLNGVGIGRNDAVAMVLPNGAEMATALLAVSIGATCAPLNPEYKEEEFRFFLEDLDAKALLIQKGMESPVRAVAEAMQLPVIELSGTGQAKCGLFKLATTADAPAAPQGGPGEADDVALILHTSGTTSRPKLVPLSQRNICATATNLARAVALTPDDVCLNVMPLFHIGGLVDLLFSPLASGGSVVCTPTFSAPHVASHIKEFAPTWSQVVPAMLRDLIDHFQDDPTRLTQDGSLRVIRVVAAALPLDLQEEFEAAFGIPVIEVYGMTETTTLIATNPLPPAKGKPGSVGQAAGPEVAIIGPDGNFLPEGEAGEVVVRGESIMTGYRNDPNANAGTFIDGWFRTGDRGYFDDDRFLFLTGRIKEIINRGGEKISPQEVDDILRTHPAVADAATFAIRHDTLGEDVAAALVLTNGASLSKDEMIRYLSDRLAYFKVPRTLFFVDAIPKTQNGKIRRSALSEEFADVEQGPAEAAHEITRPATPLGSLLSEMWANALEIDEVGSDDNFFDLGGDSLKAATFINDLHEQGGEPVFVSAIFDAPTVSQFEQFVREKHPRVGEQLLGQLVTSTASTADDREEFEL